MSDSTENEISWDGQTEQQFEQLIVKIPIFLRDMAKAKVLKKAQSLVRQDNRAAIEEKDMVDAFFSETPFGFHGPLKADMEEIKIDYVQYGYPV